MNVYRTPCPPASTAEDTSPHAVVRPRTPAALVPLTREVDLEGGFETPANDAPPRAHRLQPLGYVVVVVASVVAFLLGMHH